jgi:heat shock protein HslJ
MYNHFNNLKQATHMKKLSYILFASVLLLVSCSSSKTKDSDDNAHSSFNSLDWEGTYVGSEPCEDCKIDKRITIRKDLTYEIRTEYVNKDNPLVVMQKGTFEWYNDGSSIQLKMEDSKLEPLRYKVGENTLTSLDKNNKEIANGVKYIKPIVIQSNKLFDKEWVLVELNGKEVAKNTNEDGKTANLNFDTKGQVFGNSSCNNFSGSYVFNSDNILQFGPIASTRMMCRDMKIEDEYLQIFSNKVKYQIDNNILTFRSTNDVVVAKFKVK